MSVCLQSQGNKLVGWLLLPSFSLYLLVLFRYLLSPWVPSPHAAAHRSPSQSTQLPSVTLLLFVYLSKTHRKKKTAINNPLVWPLHFLGILHLRGVLITRMNSLSQRKRHYSGGDRKWVVGIFSTMWGWLISATHNCFWILGSQSCLKWTYPPGNDLICTLINYCNSQAAWYWLGATYAA